MFATSTLQPPAAADERGERALWRIDPPPRAPGSPLSAARSAAWVPSGALCEGLHSILLRDTRGVPLSDAQRYSHFPVTPTCSITWYFSGESFLIAPGHPPHPDSPRQALAARVSLGGPRTHPLLVWNPGPAHFMTLLLWPDAFAERTGIDPKRLINRQIAVEGLLPADWLALCDAVASAADDARRIDHIEDFLLRCWPAGRASVAASARRLADWTHGLAERAASTGTGRSQRQVERRIRQWTGQPLRDLRGIGRSERAFFDAVACVRAGQVSWCAIAERNGYADQPHLCRETRRITGCTPETLRQRIAAEESFWCYRLWGSLAGALSDTATRSANLTRP